MVAPRERSFKLWCWVWLTQELLCFLPHWGLFVQVFLRRFAIPSFPNFYYLCLNIQRNFNFYRWIVFQILTDSYPIPPNFPSPHEIYFINSFLKIILLGEKSPNNLNKWKFKNRLQSQVQTLAFLKSCIENWTQCLRHSVIRTE